ncbi:MAG TPA: hypothetical protein VM782_01250 [Stellaceae bacterium]|nr:hypothetical protein [Stellaceae bacterium]
MVTTPLPRSRRRGELVKTITTLTEQIRQLNDSTNELGARRREALRALVHRYGYAEAGRMVGMSKVRVHQIVNS